MHKAWLKAFTAVCVSGLAVSSAVADPASMAMPSHRPAQPAASSSSIWPWSKSTASAPAPYAVPNAQPAPPVAGEQISWWRHPILYFQTSYAEKKAMGLRPADTVAPHPVMAPARPKTDSISLSVPTGPPSPEFYILAAQMCERQNDVAQARQNLQRALGMWPGNADLLRAAARMEDRQGNLPLAENLYQQAANSNPQNAAALNDLGLCLAREGKLDPSLQVIEQAIHLQPDKALYRNNAATVLVEMRRDQQALAHLSAVHNPAEANFNLGQLLVDRGRAAEAGQYFQAALQLNPNMQQAQEALAKLPGNQVAVGGPTTPALVAPQQAAPTGPVLGPQQQQQTWSTGPQISYPATARTPSAGASSYVPPQYLPPVANRPGPMQR